MFLRLDSAATALLPVSCVVAWAVLSSPVSAQEADAEEVSVYIISVPMADGLEAIATRAGSAARGALRQVEGVDWRSPDQLFLGYDNSALSVLERARQQLVDGRQAYLELDLERAIELLSGAVEAFDQAAAALEDPNDLGQALLLLGASYGFNDQVRQARRVFSRLHTQMPFVQPDPDALPPDVVRLYETSAPRGARRPNGTISIESDPPGAIAYVDFLARGRTPIDVERLIPGEHVVRVTRPGATPFVESLNVRRRRTARSSAFLVDSPDFEGFADLLEEVPAAPIESLSDENPIRAIAERLQVAKIGVIRVSEAADGQVALEMLLYDVASGRRLVRGEGMAPVEVGEFEQIVQGAVGTAFEAALRPTQAVDTETIPAVAATEPPPESDAEESPFFEQWWFWTIVGGVVVAGAAAGVVGGVLSQGPPLGQDPGGQVVFSF